jgi:glycosyltransferase involved in cell wall biosynthesis
MAERTPDTDASANRPGPPRVSVVVPVFNEERTIGAIVEGIRRHDFVHEVIVVDDGSRDDTAATAERAGARVIRHPHNIGNGSSVKDGIRHATQDVVVLMDGDGQHDPEDIPKLLAHAGAYDMVVGARTRTADLSAVRSIGNGLLGRFAGYISGTRIPDLTSGFRVVDRRIALDYVPILPNRNSYTTTLTLALLKGGYAVRFEPLPTIRRRAGGVSKLRPIHDGLKVLMTIVRMVTLFAPLRIFLPASVLLVLGGLLALVLGAPPDAPWTAMVGGVVLFFLGVFADREAYLRRSIGARARRRERRD